MDEFGILKGIICTIEVFLVKKGLKPSARIYIEDDKKPYIESFFRENSIWFTYSDFKVSQIREADKNGFSNQRRDVPLDQEGIRYMYISKDRQLAQNTKAYEKNSDALNLGRALGYPECCIDFYRKNLPIQRKIKNDYVIPVINATNGLLAPFELNICGRYFDYSLISHFPCSFHCKKSIALAKEYAKSLETIAPVIYRKIRYMLTSVVIFTENDGVFLINDYWLETDIIRYKKVHGTIKNKIYNLLINSNEIKILSKNKIKIKDSVLENIYLMVFH